MSSVTFFSERFGVREARAAGFDVYLRKPIDPTDIVHVVATPAREAPSGGEVG